MGKLENTTESIGFLMDLMKEKGVSKVSYSCDEFQIELETPSQNTVSYVSGAAPQQVVPTAAAEPQKPVQNVSGKLIKSPIVGTYYNAPAPDKAPFVTVGQKIKKGDVVMIIESMKLMNEIQSQYDGTVVEILVQSGTGVEFDQPIMRIE